jgi:DNA-binding response OmpR family regulator
MGYFIKKKNPSERDPDLILIGASQFDKRNMTLSFENKRVELSNKEAELLSLLHAYANAPVERAIILQRVWGDAGAYLGRTLDVFISKLRKKLEADASVRIVNIRGIGYKLLMDVPK